MNESTRKLHHGPVILPMPHHHPILPTAITLLSNAPRIHVLCRINVFEMVIRWGVLKDVMDHPTSTSEAAGADERMTWSSTPFTGLEILSLIPRHKLLTICDITNEYSISSLLYVYAERKRLQSRHKKCTRTADKSYTRWAEGQRTWLRHCATSWEVPGSISCRVPANFQVI